MKSGGWEGRGGMSKESKSEKKEGVKVREYWLV